MLNLVNLSQFESDRGFEIIQSEAFVQFCLKFDLTFSRYPIYRPYVSNKSKSQYFCQLSTDLPGFGAKIKRVT